MIADADCFNTSYFAFIDNANSYYLITNGDGADYIRLYKGISGEPTLLGEDTSSFSCPVTIKIARSRDGNFKVYRDDVLKISVIDNDLTTSSYYRTYIQNGCTDNVYAQNSSSGTFVSQVFDTAFSTPVGGPFSSTHTVPSGTQLDYFVREASSTYGTWSSYAATSDTLRVPMSKRYQQYKANFYTAYSTHTPQLDEVGLEATTTGYYIHACADVTNITSWGNFQANSILSGDGAITYYVSTGTTCDSVEQATATWTAQTNNAPILVATAAYAGVRELFTVGSTTSDVKLTDVTLNWLEGTARPAVASAVFTNRYYMAYTTGTVAGTVNDFVSVFDRNDAITFLTGMDCYSFALYERKLYCGDANATGLVYQMESGNDDNGSDFTSSIRTKAYSMGDWDAEKEFVKMYASFSPESESILDIDITPSYHLDASTTAVTLQPVNTGEDATAGILMAKIPFAVDSNLTGRFIDVNFENTGSNDNWTLFGLSFYFRRYDVK